MQLCEQLKASVLCSVLCPPQRRSEGRRSISSVGKYIIIIKFDLTVDNRIESKKDNYTCVN